MSQSNLVCPTTGIVISQQHNTKLALSLVFEYKHPLADINLALNTFKSETILEKANLPLAVGALFTLLDAKHRLVHSDNLNTVSIANAEVCKQAKPAQILKALKHLVTNWNSVTYYLDNAPKLALTAAVPCGTEQDNKAQYFSESLLALVYAITPPVEAPLPKLTKQTNSLGIESITFEDEDLLALSARLEDDTAKQVARTTCEDIKTKLKTANALMLRYGVTNKEQRKKIAGFITSEAIPSKVANFLQHELISFARTAEANKARKALETRAMLNYGFAKLQRQWDNLPDELDSPVPEVKATVDNKPLTLKERLAAIKAKKGA